MIRINKGPSGPGPAVPRTLKQVLRDFFIPQTLGDFIFIIICLAVAWYVFTYQLPQGTEEAVCMKYYYDKICPSAILGVDAGIRKNNITGLPIQENVSIITALLNWTR